MKGRPSSAFWSSYIQQQFGAAMRMIPVQQQQQYAAVAVLYVYILCTPYAHPGVPHLSDFVPLNREHYPYNVSFMSY